MVGLKLPEVLRYLQVVSKSLLFALCVEDDGAPSITTVGLKFAESKNVSININESYSIGTVK